MHTSSSGVSFVNYDIISTINMQTMTDFFVFCFVLDYTLEDYKSCTQKGLKVGANIYGVYVSVGFQGGSCNGLLNEMGGEVPNA